MQIRPPCYGNSPPPPLPTIVIPTRHVFSHVFRFRGSIKLWWNRRERSCVEDRSKKGILIRGRHVFSILHTHTDPSCHASLPCFLRFLRDPLDHFSPPDLEKRWCGTARADRTSTDRASEGTDKKRRHVPRWRIFLGGGEWRRRE